jgi:hypothetical protein
VKQGTISALIGIHSPMHSVLVIRSWKKLYGKWPKPWQIVCIFLHDIGHLGKNYLDDVDEKREHWELGANIAHKLFGGKGFLFIAGHDSYSGFPKSDLYKADKYSWYIAPYWFLWLNNVIEPKIKCGMKNREAILDFQSNVRKSIESGSFGATHDLYIARQKEAQNG